MQSVPNKLARIASAPDVFAVRSAVLSFVRDFGFPAVFFISPVSRDSHEGRVLTNVGFDPSWARAYTRWLHRVDPLPALAFERSSCFRWSRVGELRNLSRNERRYMQILARRGMSDGLAIPVFGPGARTGLAGLGLNPDIDQLSESDENHLQAGLQASFTRYCDLSAREIDKDAELSRREIDVLCWLTRGKSNADIATILEISSGSVDTYIRRIYRKFDVNDRVAAAMAAVHFGYVIAGDYRHASRPSPPAQ